MPASMPASPAGPPTPPVALAGLLARVREQHPGAQQQLPAEQIRVRVRHLRGVHPQQLGGELLL
ncbi:PucR family transcriptional regulator, partial [Streptomyces sp. P01-F02]|nr:PucR family transcriptional regulator [Streptomyces poriferorum]